MLNPTSISLLLIYTRTISHGDSNPFSEISFHARHNIVLTKRFISSETRSRSFEAVVTRFIVDNRVRNLFRLQSVRRVRENPSLESKLTPLRGVQFAWLLFRKLEK